MNLISYRTLYIHNGNVIRLLLCSTLRMLTNSSIFIFANVTWWAEISVWSEWLEFRYSLKVQRLGYQSIIGGYSWIIRKSRCFLSLQPNDKHHVERLAATNISIVYQDKSWVVSTTMLHIAQCTLYVIYLLLSAMLNYHSTPVCQSSQWCLIYL